VDKEHVEGVDRGEVMLYALSTCGWCRKTRELLNELGVAYDFAYIDRIRGREQDEAIEEIKKFNPARSFPTLVIDGRKCIVGFKEEEIREALGR
jgi:glutaredoxin-like protein NrdH